MSSTKNDSNAKLSLGVSGIKGAIKQGLTRAQHSAMDLRKVVFEGAAASNNGQGSIQAWQQQKDKNYDWKEHVNTSDDVGCLNDSVGLEIGDEATVHYVEPQQNWSQKQSDGDGIQIVVQEHVDYQWDTEQASASRRGKF